MKISEISFEDDAFKEVIMELGVEDCEQVTRIIARKRKITSAPELHHFPNLVFLDLTKNLLAELDVSGNPLLEELYIGNNQIEELDLSKNTQLTHLEIFMNDLTDLDLTAAPRLENLFANANDLEALDLSQNPEMEEVHLSDNNLKTITLADGKTFFAFKAENNPLADDVKARLQSAVEPANLKL